MTASRAPCAGAAERRLNCRSTRHARFAARLLRSGCCGARGSRDLFHRCEGGQSTLIVTPDRHSLLIDTGWAGNGTGFNPGNPHAARDANRIVAAARDAGIRRIDYLYITHFHTDHDGGVKELSQLMPIVSFIDHGAPSNGALSGDDDTKKAFDAYAKVRAKGTALRTSSWGSIAVRRY